MTSSWGPSGTQDLWTTPTQPRASVSDQRSRISRACDRCHSLRAKCDGRNPCARCIDSKEPCDYARRLKKRGKAAKRIPGALDHTLSTTKRPASDRTIQFGSFSLSEQQDRAIDASSYSPASNQTGSSRESPSVIVGRSQWHVTSNPNATHHSEAPVAVSQTEKTFGAKLDQIESNFNSTEETAANHNVTHSLDFDDDRVIRYPYYVDDGLQAYDQLAFDVAGAELLCGDPRNMQSFRFGPNNAVEQQETPSSTPINHRTSATMTTYSEHIYKYPVLRVLVGYLNADFQISLAEKLLESYFDSLFDASPHPLSPYIFGFVLRKKAILHSSQPRVCSPAMLASMLWIAARTSDLPELSTEPTRRGQICQYLLQLTLSLLLPVMQTPAMNHASPSERRLESMNPVSVQNQSFDFQGKQKLSLDDIVAYIHISTVTSASEDKRASLRWWTSAWQLARELKLGREVEFSDTIPPGVSQHATNFSGEEENRTTEFVIEEHKEERRRVWWILYILDRHLALCYNRTLFLPDRECQQLLQPIGEDDWQSGNFFRKPLSSRICGPSILCTSPSIFGFFLPLMTILGEIVELQFVRSNTLLSLGSTSFEHEAASRAQIIEEHLKHYKQSLSNWSLQEKQQNLGNEIQAQNDTALAYAEHIMHVLHILVTGRWDPIELLNDADSWTSSESFRGARDHAVAGAQAVFKILNVDPDLSFMPFLFGVYLLQGSFLLLSIAESSQANVSKQLAHACETIVRAHEVCIVTLSTEYQKNFRNVMRSALAQVRGRQRKDLEGQRKKRREVLGLYRWTSDGCGLAL